MNTQNTTSELRASKKEYAAFLRKARKVEAMIRELTATVATRCSAGQKAAT